MTKSKRWALVPVEPTEAMVDAGMAELDNPAGICEAWHAMASASPSSLAEEDLVKTLAKEWVAASYRRQNEGHVSDEEVELLAEGAWRTVAPEIRAILAKLSGGKE